MRRISFCYSFKMFTSLIYYLVIASYTKLALLVVGTNGGNVTQHIPVLQRIKPLHFLKLDELSSSTNTKPKYQLSFQVIHHF